jgi:Protein of unknown function (DUF3303)
MRYEHGQVDPRILLKLERFGADQTFGQDPKAVYHRFREKGRSDAGGIEYVDSWVAADYTRCFQLMCCDDVTLLQRWVQRGAISSASRLSRRNQQRPCCGNRGPTLSDGLQDPAFQTVRRDPASLNSDLDGKYHTASLHGSDRCADHASTKVGWMARQEGVHDFDS